jgi:transposase
MTTKLTEVDRADILSKLATKGTGDIAERYGVSRQTIYVLKREHEDGAQPSTATPQHDKRPMQIDIRRSIQPAAQMGAGRNSLQWRP